MSGPSPITMSGAISGAPISAVPTNGSFVYVLLKAVVARAGAMIAVR